MSAEHHTSRQYTHHDGKRSRTARPDSARVVERRRRTHAIRASIVVRADRRRGLACKSCNEAAGYVHPAEEVVPLISLWGRGG